jgi:hypothetical protein
MGAMGFTSFNPSYGLRHLAKLAEVEDELQ